MILVEPAPETGSVPALEGPPRFEARLRRPTVAGYYYPREPEALRQLLVQLTGRSDATRQISSLPQAHAVLAPHGTLAFSGSVAASAFGAISIPRRCIVLGPHHLGLGGAGSVMAAGAYATPLGQVPIETSLAEALLAAGPVLAADHATHRDEHAIEALLPFLQWLGPPDLAIVPVIVNTRESNTMYHLAEALARVVARWEEPVLLVASVDLSHYDAQERVRDTDARILDAVGALDPQGVLEHLRALRPMTCATACLVSVLGAAIRLGAKRSTVTAYATSADAGGDPHSAIGYAGVVLT